MCLLQCTQTGMQAELATKCIACQWLSFCAVIVSQSPFSHISPAFLSRNLPHEYLARQYLTFWSNVREIATSTSSLEWSFNFHLIHPLRIIPIFCLETEKKRERETEKERGREREGERCTSHLTLSRSSFKRRESFALAPARLPARSTSGDRNAVVRFKFSRFR